MSDEFEPLDRIRYARAGWRHPPYCLAGCLSHQITCSLLVLEYVYVIPTGSTSTIRNSFDFTKPKLNG
jgi:hypothetical protein